MHEDALADAVTQAKAGDRQALERLVRAIQDRIYALGVRFLGHPADADDACQEILVRIITNLPSFRGDSRFETWAHRVAINHLMNYKRTLRRAELDMPTAHAQLVEAVNASADAVAEPDPLVVEEMKLACAHGMLLCLDRDLRMAYVLGVLLELSGEMAADVLGVPAATYRKRLQRARDRMREYFNPLCGLVSEHNPCRCAKMVGPGQAADIIDPSRLSYATRTRKSTRLNERTHRLLETTELLRGYPEYLRPESFAATLRQLLDRVPDLN